MTHREIIVTFILFHFIISMVLLMIILISVDDLDVQVADVDNPIDVDGFDQKSFSQKRMMASLYCLALVSDVKTLL